MRIVPLRHSFHSKSVLTLNDPNRLLFIGFFQDVCLTGRNIQYPNCLLQRNINTNNKLINPYDERVMSLKKDSFYENNEYEVKEMLHKTKRVDTPLFFFIYNVDNYFHFIYDTLPILYSYFILRLQYPDLQLLIQTSHPTKSTFAPFVLETLHSLNIDSYELADTNTIYSNLFVSTSFTHGGQSNDPPSPLCFSLWNRLTTSYTETVPKRFYISRRSWVHGKTDNIGTNYTTRRKCMNEDKLVKLLEGYGIEEVFTELLSTEQKIALFKHAELVVGIIGGGMCNLLFSPCETKALCIPTPHFLTINERFKYSMEHTKILYSDCTSLSPYEGLFPLYSRVQIKSSGIIGEVEEYKNSQYKLTVSKNDVAGFSQDFPTKTVWVSGDEVEPLDSGLNSPFTVDLKQFEMDLKQLL